MDLKDYKKLVKVKGYEIREHQQEFLTSNLFDNSIDPFVLGAGTSSGKGPMSIMWLELFYQNLANQNKLTLFVAASKTVLRTNIHEVLKKFKPSFSYSIVKDKETLVKALERKAQVLVVIPQTIKTHYQLLPKMHNFILDEAHEWYFAKVKGGKQSTLDKIINHIKPTKQLLLTGTPSKFIANGDKFNFQFVPVMDLYDMGLVSNVKLEVVSSTYDFKANDWLSSYGNLKSTKTNSPKQAEDALVAVCNEMINKLKNPLKEWYNINNVTKNSIGKLFKYLDKTIIYTHSTKQANKFYDILNSKKELSGKVLLSHSDNDPDSIEFNKFKTDENCHILIAVDRGRIGFDMPELFNIVDFTMTQNLDMLLQMYGRLLRKSSLQKKKQKIYFKVATKNTADYFVDLMTAMLCLTHMEWYSKYNGKNMGGIRIPKVLTKSIRNKNYQQPKQKSKSNKVKPYVSLTELGIPMDLNFFRQSILHSSNSKFNTIAETTLDECRRQLFGINNKTYSKDELFNMVKNAKRPSDIKNRNGVVIADMNNFKRLCITSGNWNGYDGEQYYNDITKHIVSRFDEKWDIKSAKKEVIKYKKISDIPHQLKHWIEKNNLKDIMYAHINKRIDWTEDRIMEEALKYTKKVDFQKAPNVAYKAARRLGILDKVCAHMEQKVYWTEKMIKDIIKENKFTHKIQLRRYSSGAHHAAARFGILDKLKSGGVEKYKK